MPTYAGQLVLHSQNLALLALVAALVLVSSVAAQDELTRIAPGQQRAEVSAAFYVCIYLGVSVPVIGIGLVAVATTLFTAVTTFAAVTGGGALILAAWHLRNRGQAAGQTAPDQDRTGHPVRSSR